MHKNRFVVGIFILGLALMVGAVPCRAQTVTVNSGGGADYTTIEAAYSAVASNAEEPNVITITGGGPYEVSLSIGVPLTLQGESETDRPILLIQMNPGDVSGRESDGIVNSAPVDMTFENLICLPSLENTPTDDGFDIRPFSDDDDFSVTLRNVLIAANDGNNAPISVDGKEHVQFTGDATSFGDDGFQILSTFSGIPSGTMNALIEDVVVTHIDADNSPESLGSGNDSFILGGENLTVTVRNTYVSYGDRFGYQLLSNVTVNLEGTATEPIVVNGGFAGIGSTGIRCFSGDHVWSHVHVLNTWNGVAVDSDTTTSLAVDHLLIADVEDWGLSFIYTPPAERDFTFANCTLYNNPNTVVFDATSDDADLDRVTVTFTDSVFAGWEGDEIFVQTFLPEPIPEGATFPNIVLDHTAVVEEGDYAVFFGYREEDFTETGVISSDPVFVSTDSGDEGFLRVSADAYKTAASDGGPLRGAVPFAGEPVSVDSWMMF